MKPIEIVQIDTARGYAAWARGYDAQDNPMIAAVERYLDRHRLPFLGARVLDIGCGTGRTMARALAEGAAAVTGLDASEEMLALARERLAAPVREGRVALQNADLARPWPKLAPDFDLAVITLVLEHTAEMVPILRQVSAHLAKGALLFVAEIHPDMLKSGLGGHFQRDGIAYALPSHPHDEREFASSLAAAGFDAPVFDTVHADAETIAAIPKFAKHAGAGVMLTVRTVRS